MHKQMCTFESASRIRSQSLHYIYCTYCAKYKDGDYKCIMYLDKSKFGIKTGTEQDSKTIAHGAYHHGNSGANGLTVRTNNRQQKPNVYKQ